MLNFENLKDLVEHALLIKNADRGQVILSYNSQDFELFYKKYNNYKTLIFNEVDKTIETKDSKVYYLNDPDILDKKNTVPFDREIVLLSHNDQIVLYNPITKEQSDKKYFIINILAYRKFLELLNNRNLIDINSTAEQKYILFSDTFGINEISYKASNTLSLSENLDFMNLVNRFSEELTDDLLYSEFIKSEIIRTITRVNVDNHIDTLIKSLDTIINQARKEYKIYLKKFSFESLKNALILEKEKYFKSLRELLAKLFTQVIAIPISATALIFTIGKLSTSELIKLFIIVYLLMSLIVLAIQFYYLFDQYEIHKQFKLEFKKIKSNSGLPQKEIKIERNKILRRLTFNYLLIVLLVFLTIFLFILAYQYGINRIIQLEEENTIFPLY